MESLICIVGTTKTKNVDCNMDSFGVKLSKDDREITDSIPISEVEGNRITDNYVKCSWKFANTPLRQAQLV
jgi:diketogulonate reductase-like aldo/keto reductase